MARKKTTTLLTPAQLELAKAIREAEDLAPLFADAWRKVVGTTVEESGWRREFEYMQHLRKWRFDFAHVPTRVAVEVDGGQKLAKISPKTGRPVAVGRHAGDEDHWKIATAVADHWRVFQLTPTMLKTNPVLCVKLVARAVGVLIRKDIDA